MSCAALQEVLQAKDKNDCFSVGTVATEKGKKFTLHNRSGKQVCRVHVDGCLLDSTEHKKCDYLFKVAEPAHYFLVELKGSNVSDAIKQLVKTFDILNGKIRTDPKHFTGVIVSTGVPRATENDFRKLQDKIYKEKKLRIRKTTNQFTENI